MIYSLYREIRGSTCDLVYNEVTSTLFVDLYHHVWYRTVDSMNASVEHAVNICVYAAIAEDEMS